jgi:hypothetical protein
MPVTIVGKLNQPAREFQAGNSTGFGFKIGEQYYNRQTQQREWTNYECAVFSNKQNVIEAYRNKLVQDAVVCVSGGSQSIETFDSKNGPMHSIKIHDCNLVRVFVDEGAAPQQQNYGNNQYGNQQPQQAYQPPAPEGNYQPAHGNPASQNNGFRPDHPRNTGAAPSQQNANAQPAVASPSRPAPTMDSFEDDIPFN